MIIPMHAGHPLIVHLPLIAFVAAVGFDLLDAWSAQPRFRQAATMLWWAALAGAAAAIATGLLAYGRVDHSDLAHVAMTLHRNVALGTVTLLLGAAVSRWRHPRSRTAVLLALAGLGALAWVGDLGASLVFRHALGIPTARLTEVLNERGGEDGEVTPHEHESMSPALPNPTDSMPMDGMAAAPPTGTQPHPHRDSMPRTD